MMEDYGGLCPGFVGRYAEDSRTVLEQVCGREIGTKKVKVPLQNQETKETLSFYMCTRCGSYWKKRMKGVMFFILPAKKPTVAAGGAKSRSSRVKKGAAAAIARGAAAASAVGGASGGSSEADDEDEAAPAAPAAAPRRAAALGGAPQAPAAAAAAVRVAEASEKENRKLFAPPPATRPACWASAVTAGVLKEADADVAAVLQAAEPAGTLAMTLGCLLRFKSPLAAAPPASDLAAALERVRSSTSNDFAPFRIALACSPVGAFMKGDTVTALWSGACPCL